MPALSDINSKIRESARKLLADGRAEVVIGYRQGTVPMTTSPMFARKPAECDQLIWSNFARINLANYLPGRPGKVALVAKGCDARSAVGQVTENQILKDNLYIIGVPCTGMIDTNLVLAKETRPIKELVETTDEAITVKGEGFSTEINKADVLRRNCQTCANRTPKLADELIGPETPGANPDDFADIKALLNKTPDERMAYFKDLIKDCLRCYACRNACPLCYCPICFVDETRPQWLGKSTDPMDTLTFHILRGLHCSGRCTSCGACETACPVNIKVREFNRVTELTVQNNWHYEAGQSWDQKPPLTMFQTDDQADFIK
ncbi:MAG: Coenzyme F420 hydrogenase/dehydrogenase, beta subunit C-terminal domain [Deltaproteobacteria bacterium]|jgi:coenzyme F420-reducing hydrogenase beta subunit|nr:Coenzyme F420 hydrogenase/dehydrogenase, beta subunit C-terminal domain [Deltaproteobacteria bacterium]